MSSTVNCVDCRHAQQETDYLDRNLVCNHPQAVPRVLGPRVPECGPEAKLFQIRPQVPDEVNRLAGQVGQLVEDLRTADLVTEEEADTVASILFRARKRSVNKIVAAENEAAWLAALPPGPIDLKKLLRETIARITAGE